jgi:hypothetical protein
MPYPYSPASPLELAFLFFEFGHAGSSTPGSTGTDKPACSALCHSAGASLTSGHVKLHARGGQERCGDRSGIG